MHSVLDNVRRSDSPFPYAITDSCLPGDYYHTLVDTRPDWRLIAGEKASKSNIRCDMHAHEIINSDISETWRQFVYQHTSNGFWQQFVSLFGDSIRLYYPWLERAYGKRLQDMRTGVRYIDKDIDIHMECQLSVNTPAKERSRVIGPHLDNPTELYGSLLYMRDPDDTTDGGELEAYNLYKKEPIIQGKREVLNVTPSMQKVPYATNNYFGFLNTPRSVHGVSERAASGKPRLMVNVTIELMNMPLFNPEIYRV